MKKILSVLLCLALGAGVLAGCSHQEEPSPTPSPSPEVSQVSSEPYKIGLVQYREHGELDSLREAFMSRLEEWGCDEDRVEIDYQNAGGDPVKAEEICDTFVKGGVDMIVAISTPAAKAAIGAAAGTQVKVVFAGVSGQEALGLEEGTSSSSQVTGVVSPMPVGDLLALAQQADSTLKTLGLLYDPSDPGALAVIEDVKAACGEKGLEVAEATVSSQEEVAQAMAELCGRVDAVFTPPDNTVAPMAAEAAQAAKTAQVPWYTGSDAMVQSGALAAMGATGREMGVKAADMAVELMEGRELSQVPVYTFESPSTFVNQTTLAALSSLTFPTEALQSAFVYQ